VKLLKYDRFNQNGLKYTVKYVFGREN